MENFFDIYATELGYRTTVSPTQTRGPLPAEDGQRIPFGGLFAEAGIIIIDN